MKFYRLCGAAATAVALSACSTMSGPKTLYGVMETNPNKLLASAGNCSRELFCTRLNEAYDVRNSRSRSARVAANRAVMSSGFLIVHQNCAVFLEQLHSKQRGSNMARDIISTIIPLATTALLIGNSELSNVDEDILAVLTLGATASNAGLEIYNRHALLGITYIPGGSEFVLRNLAENANTALQFEVTDLAAALGYILQNEQQCAPSTIYKNASLVFNNIEIKTKTKEPSQPHTDENTGKDTGTDEKGQDKYQPGILINPPRPNDEIDPLEPYVQKTIIMTYGNE